MAGWFDIGIAGLTPVNLFATATGDLAMGSNKITGAADGTADTDLATVGQMNLLFQGVKRIEPCRLRATGNVVLASALEAGDSIDSTVLVEGDRVLCDKQTTVTED